MCYLYKPVHFTKLRNAVFFRDIEKLGLVPLLFQVLEVLLVFISKAFY